MSSQLRTCGRPELFQCELGRDVWKVEEVFLDEWGDLARPNPREAIWDHLRCHEERLSDRMVAVELRFERGVELHESFGEVRHEVGAVTMGVERFQDRNV